VIDKWRQSDSSEIDAEFDAGFDLFVPTKHTVLDHDIGIKVSMGIKCSMTLYQENAVSIPTGYYLYPRSSTGTKTPLRLSNSVGVIDDGYKGHIIALFDNNSNKEYTINENDRVVQICAPNIIYPILPVLVNSVDDIYRDQHSNNRGIGGFGSTGV